MSPESRLAGRFPGLNTHSACNSVYHDAVYQHHPVVTTGPERQAPGEALASQETHFKEEGEEHDFSQAKQ
jgi:hypothetical protein